MLLFAMMHLLAVPTRQPSTVSQQAQSSLTSSLTKFFEQPEFEGTLVGCKVVDSEGHVLFEKNDELRLVPASNNKLFGCSFALHTLGYDYRPEIKFWKEPDGLYIRSEGDPLFQMADIKLVLGQLGKYNHDNVYVSEAYDPGYKGDWEYGDLPNRYAAPITALTFDRASLYLNDVNGVPTLAPQSFGIKIIWTDRKSPDYEDIYNPFFKTITITGALPEDMPRLDTLSIPTPDVETAKYFGKNVNFDKPMPTRAPDVIHQGMPLQYSMRQCLQQSDNFMAESFLLMAASRKGDLGDSYSSAISQLYHFLFDVVGLSPVELIEADGSGLSRQNSVSVDAISDLLLWHEKQPDFQEWLSLLDYPGGGTMITRLHDVPFKGKTGTMTRISALSGYILPNGMKPVVISVIEDNYQCSTQRMKELENNLVRLVYQYLKSPTPSS